MKKILITLCGLALSCPALSQSASDRWSFSEREVVGENCVDPDSIPFNEQSLPICAYRHSASVESKTGERLMLLCAAETNGSSRLELRVDFSRSQRPQATSAVFDEYENQQKDIRFETGRHQTTFSRWNVNRENQTFVLAPSLHRLDNQQTVSFLQALHHQADTKVNFAVLDGAQRPIEFSLTGSNVALNSLQQACGMSELNQEVRIKRKQRNNQRVKSSRGHSSSGRSGITPSGRRWMKNSFGHVVVCSNHRIPVRNDFGDVVCLR